MRHKYCASKIEIKNERGVHIKNGVLFSTSKMFYRVRD